ncbi:MAG: hypothetical protein J6P89_09010 [Oscillospiraceae bacterium]|nr:hypothetical protein [Oscillospiraceae bacterium]
MSDKKKLTEKEEYEFEITKLHLEIDRFKYFALSATAKCSECGKEMKFNDRICYYSSIKGAVVTTNNDPRKNTTPVCHDCMEKIANDPGFQSILEG